MNAPVREPPIYGTPDAYREAIHEALGMVRIQAQLGETYAALGDDVGLVYTMRKLVAQAQFALGTLGDLQELKAKRGRA